jgi:hypothetical protein
MGRTVETGIVLTGKDVSASKTLNKAADEAERLDKQVTSIGKGAAQATPGLGRFAGELGLAGGAAFAAFSMATQAVGALVQALADAAPDMSELRGEISSLDSALIGINQAAKDGAGSFEMLVGAVSDYFDTAIAEAERFRLQLEGQARTRGAYTDSVRRAAERETELEREAAKEQADLGRKLDEIRKKHEDEDKKRHDAWKRREENEQRMRERGVAAVQKSIEDREKHNKENAANHAANVDYMAELEKRASDGVSEIQLSNLARVSDQQERDAELYQRTLEAGMGVASDIGNAFGQHFAAIAMGTETVNEALADLAVTGLQTVIAMVQRAIMAYAAESAAAAFASQASIPFVGPLLGAAAASAAFGVVAAYAGSFAQGGVVRGGVKGRDSVPILAQDGERVLTVQQSQSFDRLVSAISGAGGRVGAMSGGGSAVVVNVSSSVPVSRAQLDRVVRDSVLPATKRLGRRGYKVG